MATWIIFTVALLLLAMILHYRRVRQYYVDLSIYQLRQCKHDLIIYRTDHIDSLSKQDLKDLQWLIDSAQKTADKFREIGGIKFKTIKIIINNTVQSMRLETKGPRILNEHPELLAHYIMAVGCSMKAIPFLRLRVIIYLIRMVLNTLIAFGIKRANRYLEQFNQFINANNDNHYNNHCMNI